MGDFDLGDFGEDFSVEFNLDISIEFDLQDINLRDFYLLFRYSQSQFHWVPKSIPLRA